MNGVSNRLVERTCAAFEDLVTEPRKKYENGNSRRETQQQGAAYFFKKTFSDGHLVRNKVAQKTQAQGGRQEPMIGQLSLDISHFLFENRWSDYLNLPDDQMIIEKCQMIYDQ
jgi:hypothetical protein